MKVPIVLFVIMLISISLICVSMWIFSRDLEVEKFYYDNTVSFDSVLDHACDVNTNHQQDQYHDGECVTSTCPVETCTQNGTPQTSPQDFLGGSCMSKQIELPNIYTNCSPATPTATATATHPSHTAGNTTGNTAGNTAGNTTGNTAGNTAGNTTGNTTGNTAGNTTGNTAGVTPTATPTYVSGATTTTSSTPRGPDYLRTNYAELKNCDADEYWNAPNNQCETCGNDVLKYRRSVTHNTACEPVVDCSAKQVKCYVSPSCDVEFKEKLRNEDSNICELPENCATSCKVSNVCRLNPRIPCVHPEDGSFERYEYNEDCVLTSVNDSTKTIESCERCRAYVDEETGVIVRRRLRRVGAAIKCVEL